MLERVVQCLFDDPEQDKRDFAWQIRWHTLMLHLDGHAMQVGQLVAADADGRGEAEQIQVRAAQLVSAGN